MKGRLSIRKLSAVVLLSVVLVLMSVLGYQSALKYQTLIFHSEVFWHLPFITGAAKWVVGALGVVLLSALFYMLFHFLEKRDTCAKDPKSGIRSVRWLVAGGLLFVIYMFFLWSCYPGFYNYDMGNQLPQVLYKDVPYNAHHPLLHTLLGGGMIKIGYMLRNEDLTFGVFLYNLVQMGICAMGMGYALCFVHRKCRRLWLDVLSFLFFALCPPVVIFAMSTTKDTPCYISMLVGTLLLFEIYERLLAEKRVGLLRWAAAGFFLMLSCLLRKNIIYALVVFACFVVFWIRKSVKKQILLYVSVMIGYFVINNALIVGLHAPKSSVAEALSVPFQHMARLYYEYGEEAFSEEELEYFYSCVDREMLSTYDPVNADNIKTSFWLHLDYIMMTKKDFFGLWVKKGMEYPFLYLQATVDNTYQAWYPWTFLQDKRILRYLDITDWQEKFNKSHWMGLYQYYVSTNEYRYTRTPILRLLFVTGTYVWSLLIALAFSWFRKDRSAAAVLFWVFLVAGTSLCGPVMDIRYFLILFYLFPVEIAMMLSKTGSAEEKQKETS